GTGGSRVRGRRRRGRRRGRSHRRGLRALVRPATLGRGSLTRGRGLRRGRGHAPRGELGRRLRVVAVAPVLVPGVVGEGGFVLVVEVHRWGGLGVDLDAALLEEAVESAGKPL